MILNTEELSSGIAEVVRRYGIEQLGIRPGSISVDIHNRSVIVTLEGVSHPAEVDLSRERLSREMVEKMYVEMFNISKSVLYLRLENVLGRTVDRSFFAIESEYGDAVIVLFFLTAFENVR
ncbi:MAG: Na-translocating system protein MpsC family protein [Chitinivibrionales bacterium]